MRHIEAKMTVSKIISVDSDDLNEAIKEAEKKFYEYELTDQFLNDREVTFEEFPYVKEMAIAMIRHLSSKYDKNLDEEIIVSETKNYIRGDDLIEAVNKEMLDIFKENNKSIETISI